MIADGLTLLTGAFNPVNLALTGQLVTAIGATPGTNTIDTGPLASAQNSDYGTGQELDITVRILQTLTSAGAATVQFQLIQADDPALSVNVQVINQTDAFPFALLTAGTDIPLAWSRDAPYVPKRYAGLRTVIAGAALTNATGWLAALVGVNHQDLGVGGRGPIFKAGFSVT